MASSLPSVEFMEGIAPAMRVLIADDHPVVRKGVRAVLAEMTGIEDIHEAATKNETLEKVVACQPTLVIMNTTLVDANSIEVLRAIKRIRPQTTVILLHPVPDPQFTTIALASGASAVITKLGQVGELAKAIEATKGDGVYIGADIAALMNDSDPI